MLSVAIAALLGYLLGSIATGAIVSRRFGTDVRQRGSGSTGGTNIARIHGWKAGLAVIVADAFKGYLAVRLMAGFGPDPTGVGNDGLQLVAGLATIAGHIWPAFSGFRGGKGVATSAGVLLALAPEAFLIGIGVFALTLTATRIVSLSSMAAELSVPLGLAVLRWTRWGSVSGMLLGYAAVAAGLILFAHRDNLARLRAGTEPTI